MSPDRERHHRRRTSRHATGEGAMSYQAESPEAESLVDRREPVRRLATGFIFTEGPIWHPREHYLLFSDMPGDVRRRWDEKGGAREVRRPANKCNGMTRDAELNLIVCSTPPPASSARRPTAAAKS